MKLCDYHVHSDISLDSKASMRDMVLAEQAYGIEHMCFTNHCDMADWRTYRFQESCLDVVPETFRKYGEMRARFGDAPIDVSLGIELGEPLFAPETACEIARSPGLDFVLGSLHILREHGDVWFIKFLSAEHCRRVYADYLDELLQIASLDYFDVMAHIGYARRCMLRQGFDEEMSLERYGEKIELLLRRLIDNGRGIEINCSGIRDGCGPFPQPEILRLYKSLGGEIITIGSDAHSAANAAKCIREGVAALRECGFDHVSIYKGRSPQSIKL